MEGDCGGFYNERTVTFRPPVRVLAGFLLLWSAAVEMPEGERVNKTTENLRRIFGRQSQVSELLAPSSKLSLLKAVTFAVFRHSCLAVASFLQQNSKWIFQRLLSPHVLGLSPLLACCQPQFDRRIILARKNFVFIPTASTPHDLSVSRHGRSSSVMFSGQIARTSGPRSGDPRISSPRVSHFTPEEDLPLGYSFIRHFASSFINTKSPRYSFDRGSPHCMTR